MYTMMRFQIENRTITPMGKLQLIDEKGKQIKGTCIYAWSISICIW